jgi:hypothetical protein
MTDVNDAPDNSGQADGATKTWYDGADADTVGFIQNKKWDNPLKVINDYRNLEKFHGVPADQLVKLPKQDDVAAWDAVYNKLGRPEAPDKYGKDGLKLVEGFSIDDSKLNAFDALAHKAGLTKTQRDMVYNGYFESEAKSLAGSQEADAQEKSLQEAALKKEWGNKYDERVELARRAFRAFVPQGVDPESVAAAFESSMGVAITAKMFANLADKMAEDTFKSNNGGSDRAFGYTKEQAVNDKNTLMSELKADVTRLGNYNRGIGPDYDKMARLNKMIAEG